jgi:protein-disulfide isomerase
MRHPVIPVAMLVSLATYAAACAPAPAPTPAPTPAVNAATREAPPAPSPEPTAEAPPPAPAPRPASPVASPSSPGDTLALERNPGQTPPLPDVAFPAPAAIEGHPGAPGPSPSMGPEDAPVILFVFSDFQCPVCRRAVEPLKKLVRDLAPDVRVVFKQMALPSHPRARGAAIASLAAFRAGHFFAFHDRLFASQRELDDATLRAHAEAVGADLATYDDALQDPALGAQVDHESAVGTTLGVRGTPGFIVNGKVSVGWGSYAGLEGTVRGAVEAWRASGLPRGLETARRLTAETDPNAAEALFPSK